MKYLKILGLAAIAAAALMAFAGAGTATADELCTTTALVNNHCETPITTIEASQEGSGKLKTTGGATLATCSSGGIHIGEITQGTGVSPIIAHEVAIEFPAPGAGCSTTVDQVPGGTGEATEGAGGGTTLTSIGGKVTLELFGVSCVYTTGVGTDLGEVSTSGTISFSKVVTKSSGGGLCPASGIWEAAFQMTNHNEIHYHTN